VVCVNHQQRDNAFKALFAVYEARCEAAGVKPKSKRAVAAVLAARFAKCKANGGEIHYGAQLRKGLTIVAA
jgi:hypothetical protein